MKKKEIYRIPNLKRHQLSQKTWYFYQWIKRLYRQKKKVFSDGIRASDMIIEIGKELDILDTFKISPK